MAADGRPVRLTAERRRLLRLALLLSFFIWLFVRPLRESVSMWVPFAAFAGRLGRHPGDGRPVGVTDGRESGGRRRRRRPDGDGGADDRPPICPACGVTMGIQVAADGSVQHVCQECGYPDDGS